MNIVVKKFFKTIIRIIINKRTAKIGKIMFYEFLMINYIQIIYCNFLQSKKNYKI